MNSINQEKFKIQKRKRVRKPTPESTDGIKIEDFIVSTLTLGGFQKNVDFTVSSNRLFIHKNPIRGKLLHVLKETFPQYSYYWETPKTLIWF